MAFFTSEYECKLDAKGRLVLPAKIKSSLPEVSTHEFVIRRGFEPNLLLYPMLEFRKLQARIAALSDFNEEQRRLKRTFFSTSTDVEMDKAGRIRLSRTMLAHAQIDNDALLVGMGSYIEIWNPEIFVKYQVEDPMEYSNLAQKYLDE